MELHNVNINKYLYNSYNDSSINDLNLIYSTYNSCLDMFDVVDLSNNFPKVYDQENYGITSSCAILGILSYLHKINHNSDIELSPFHLASLQFNLTKNWYTLDIQSGLYAILNNSICLNDSFDKKLVADIFSNDNINDKSYFSKIKSYIKININLKNTINLLNDQIPILCSIKILPKYHDRNFYDCFSDKNYWLNCNSYYLSEQEIYSVSVTIVGYNKLDNTIKIRGCWGTNIGNNGYIYIPFDIFEEFTSGIYGNNLFFDCFIINKTSPLITNMQLFNNLDNDYIVEFDKNITPTNIKKQLSFGKTKSWSSFTDSTIEVEIHDNLDYILNNGNLSKQLEYQNRLFT